MTEQIFKIDRAKWLNGASRRPSEMCNEHGEKCCLGFITQQATNCKDEELAGISPDDAYFRTGVKFPPLFDSEGMSDLCGEAMQINDCEFKSPECREELLTELFQQHGIKIEFHGEYPKQSAMNIELINYIGNLHNGVTSFDEEGD